MTGTTGIVVRIRVAVEARCPSPCLCSTPSLRIVILLPFSSPFPRSHTPYVRLRGRHRSISINNKNRMRRNSAPLSSATPLPRPLGSHLRTPSTSPDLASCRGTHFPTRFSHLQQKRNEQRKNAPCFVPRRVSSSPTEPHCHRRHIPQDIRVAQQLHHPRQSGAGGGVGGYSLSYMAVHRRSHPYNVGTEHVGVSPTRQIFLPPSAKRREVLGALYLAASFREPLLETEFLAYGWQRKMNDQVGGGGCTKYRILISEDEPDLLWTMRAL